MDEEKLLVNRAEEFLQLFKKGAEFTQELLKENERLRFRILELEQAGKIMPIPLSEENDVTRRLQSRIMALEQEKKSILMRVQQIKQENSGFAQRYLDVEQENNSLANLYIASYQLHSTLDYQEVLQNIIEILINMIGADEFAIMLIDEREQQLQAVTSEGIGLEDIPRISLGVGIVGQVAESGESHFAESIKDSPGSIENPLVAIPMMIKENVIGVIVITKMLVQKESFAPVDFELFTLLAAHAATAIFASRLYTSSERKLTTIQGFLDLLTCKV